MFYTARFRRLQFKGRDLSEITGSTLALVGVVLRDYHMVPGSGSEGSIIDRLQDCTAVDPSRDRSRRVPGEGLREGIR